MANQLAVVKTSFYTQHSLKHAAEEDPQTPSSKHPRMSKPTSINGILRRNARQRLYVRPLKWTAQHLHLLGCEFSSRDRGCKDREADQVEKEEKAAVDQRLLHSIAEATKCMGPGHLCKGASIGYILENYGLKETSYSRIPFDFAERPVCRLSTNGIFAPAGTAPAALAFLDLYGVRDRRHTSFLGGIGRRLNPPAVRLAFKKLARVRPNHVAHDPYIAAVLISLAQGLRYEAMMGSQTPPANGAPISPPKEPVELPQKVSSLKVNSSDQSSLKPETRQVFLLATFESNLYVYDAGFPDTFLDRLDKPSEPSYLETVSIHYSCIPFSSEKGIDRAMERITKSMHKDYRTGI
ncbi:hypothetical protein S40288_10676 [Stachybotrys chartarum IBT 40288]|nr:hypothetical protein S40288_10676 [Stachybotrys chartarum IBT 40288]